MLRSPLSWCGLFAVAMLMGTSPSRAAAKSTKLYVSTRGNNSWSGTLPEPNAARTDGPFATIARARDAIRILKRDGGLKTPVTVLVRAGTYYLSRPLELGPADSGTATCPITYRVAEGKTVVLSAGRRITGPWHTDDGKIYQTHLPEVKAGTWYFRQLRVGTEGQVRARIPNFDAAKPYTGGWRLASPAGLFGWCMGSVQDKGTWMEYPIDVPADGQYALRILYANSGNTNQKFWQTRDMSDRTTIRVDDGRPVLLADLTDTGSFYAGFRWSRSATLELKRGKHVLRWTNVKGGGLHLDAFALASDPKHEPRVQADGELAPPPNGVHMVVFQAESYSRHHGEKIQAMCIDRKAPRFRTQFQFTPGSLPPLARTRDVEVFVIPKEGWVSELVRLEHLDAQRGLIRISGANCMKAIWPGNRFFVTNVREGLDSPGEWCLQRSSGMLWYWPKKKDFAKAEMVAPVLDRVIDLCGDPTKKRFVSYVNIEGFTITDTRFVAADTIRDVYHPNDAAVWLRGATHCRVARCTFRNVGGYGVCVYLGSTDNAVVGNHIFGSGQGGVHLNGIAKEIRKPAPRELRPARNRVAGNHIHHLGRFYKHVAGVYVAYSHDNTITHNFIHDVPRYAISLKFDAAGNLIAYNEIRRTCLETSDTGAIEFTGPRHHGDVVDHNLIVDTIGLQTTSDGRFRTPFYSWGIYLDGLVSGVTVTNNIVIRNYRGGVMLNGGSDNLITNNVFVAGTAHGVELNNYARKGKGNTFRGNIVCVTDPEALALRGAHCHKGFLSSDHNLFWNLAGPVKVQSRGENAAPTWSDWRKRGFDTHSLVADPLFVNHDKDDYRLKPNSPALKMGFKPIDTSRVGLKGAAATDRRYLERKVLDD